MSRRELSDFEVVTRSCFRFDLDSGPLWRPRKYMFEVDDPPEGRTWETVWEIVFLQDFLSIHSFHLL